MKFEIFLPEEANELLKIILTNYGYIDSYTTQDNQIIHLMFSSLNSAAGKTLYEYMVKNNLPVITYLVVKNDIFITKNGKHKAKISYPMENPYEISFTKEERDAWLIAYSIHLMELNQ